MRMRTLSCIVALLLALAVSPLMANGGGVGFDNQYVRSLERPLISLTFKYSQGGRGPLEKPLVLKRTGVDGAVAEIPWSSDLQAVVIIENTAQAAEAKSGRWIRTWINFPERVVEMPIFLKPIEPLKGDSREPPRALGQYLEFDLDADDLREAMEAPSPVFLTLEYQSGRRKTRFLLWQIASSDIVSRAGEVVLFRIIDPLYGPESFRGINDSVDPKVLWVLEHSRNISSNYGAVSQSMVRGEVSRAGLAKPDESAKLLQTVVSGGLVFEVFSNPRKTALKIQGKRLGVKDAEALVLWIWDGGKWIPVNWDQRRSQPQKAGNWLDFSGWCPSKTPVTIWVWKGGGFAGEIRGRLEVK